MKKMKVECIKHPVFPYIIVDNWYSPEEEKNIWKELDFLTSHKENLTRAEDDNTLVARHPDGNPKGKHFRIYPERIFTGRNYSSILKYNNKLIFEKFAEFVKSAIPQGVHWSSTNEDSTLISYYENNDYYDPHWDSATTTVLRWFFKEPKKFKGGDLTFTQSGETVKCKHNRMILFPGYYLHKVSPIQLNQKHINQGLGRYTLTTFFYYKG
jgi:hypothetical protein